MMTCTCLCEQAALLEVELRLSAVEQEKTQQQAALSERTSSLHQLTLKKQQMTVELESHCKKLDLLKGREKYSSQHIYRFNLNLLVKLLITGNMCHGT